MSRRLLAVLVACAFLLNAPHAMGQGAGYSWISITSANRQGNPPWDIYWDGEYWIGGEDTLVSITGKYRTPKGTTYGNATTTTHTATSWHSFVACAAGEVCCAGELIFDDEFMVRQNYWTEGEICV